MSDYDKTARQINEFTAAAAENLRRLRRHAESFDLSPEGRQVVVSLAAWRKRMDRRRR